ncbi:MAG TPA: energy transducer TonB, partial [Pyrinomonadaceae bacterium]|nr:energy transducer TonB [Pyrinomonadaceae bacterium]
DMGGDYWKEVDPSFGKAKITKPLKVTFKQKAQYTSEARSNGIEGVVKLRVTFLASGKIGSITTIQGLPYGLTEQAIEAARKMTFEAEEVAGAKRTTTRPVAFTFNIY